MKSKWGEMWIKLLWLIVRASLFSCPVTKHSLNLTESMWSVPSVLLLRPASCFCVSVTQTHTTIAHLIYSNHETSYRQQMLTKDLQWHHRKAQLGKAALLQWRFCMGDSWFCSSGLRTNPVVLGACKKRPRRCPILEWRHDASMPSIQHGRMDFPNPVVLTLSAS